jgi:hypothetical protein
MMGMMGLVTWGPNGGFQWLCNLTGWLSGSDFDSDGNWYAVALDGGLYQLNPGNGNMTYIASTTSFNSLVYDTTTGIWYACGFDTNNIDSLFSIDIQTGETTFIGHFGTPNIMISLMCDTDGNMYSYDVLFGGDSHLYSIDTSTGVATVIGDMGYDFCYAQEGKFDRNTGILYLAPYDIGMSQTYWATCDPATGEVTILNIFPPGTLVDALTAIYGDAGHYPHAEFTWTPPTPIPEETILFNASASYDFDGYITLYEWDWNSDGVYEESSATPTATHSWDSPGSYEVTLRVTDNSSLTGQKSKTIEVIPSPPSPPKIYGTTTGIVNVSYTFYTDAITNPNGDAFYFMWNWGDGNITDWLGPFPSGQTITGSHAWTHAGVYEVRAKIKWTGGESDWSAPHNITIVNNSGPTAPIIKGPTHGKTGVMYNYTFNSTVQVGDGVSYWINWGDGTQNYTSGHSGNETLVNHTWSKKGTYTVKARAQDMFGAYSNWSTLIVTMPAVQSYPSIVSWLLERFPHAFPILRYLLKIHNSLEPFLLF